MFPVDLQISSPQLVVALHFLSSPSIVLCFVSLWTWGFCTLRTETQKAIATQRHRTTLFFNCILASSFVFEGLIHLWYFARRQNLVSQDRFVYICLQIFLWTPLSLNIAHTSSPFWLAYMGSWALTLVSEGSILALTAFIEAEEGENYLIEKIAHSLRIATVLCLLGTNISSPKAGCSGSRRVYPYPTNDRPTSFPFAARTKSNISETMSVDGTQLDTVNLASNNDNEEDRDSKPLNKSTINHTDIAEEDQTADSDEEDDRALKEQQLQRLYRDGGWIGYLQGFQLLWQHAWPYGNRRIQLYMFIVLLNVVFTRILTVLYPQQLGIVIDKLAHNPQTTPWMDILLWMLYATLVSDSCGLGVISQLLEDRISNWSKSQVENAAFGHVMNLSMDYHDNSQSSSSVKALSQANGFGMLLKSVVIEILPIILDLFVSIWYISYVMDVYAVLALLLVWISYNLVTYYMAPVLTKARQEYSSIAQVHDQKIFEAITNWRTIVYWNQQDYEQDRLRKLSNDLVSADQWHGDSYQLLFIAQDVCNLGGRFAVLCVAAYLISRGTMSVGEFVTVSSYWDAVTKPFWILGHSFRRLSSELLDSERLLQLFQTKSSVRTKPGARSLDLQKGLVEFSDVNFAYSGAQHTLSSINFSVREGQTIALVGESGSGKSSILKLLMRFYEVDSGCIRIDGQDISDVTIKSLRESFGLIAQDATVFDTSVRENVRYGRLDASEEQIHQACKAALIHDKIMSLPKGYDTTVGERGVKLSAGELQRLALARLILRDPFIILLDEATSAVDSQTEAGIQRTLRTITRGRTTIIVAHRLSTITHATLILVLDKGKIVERGTHKQLLALGQRYSNLWTQQTRPTDK